MLGVDNNNSTQCVYPWDHLAPLARPLFLSRARKKKEPGLVRKLATTVRSRRPPYPWIMLELTMVPVSVSSRSFFSAVWARLASSCWAYIYLYLLFDFPFLSSTTNKSSSLILLPYTCTSYNSKAFIEHVSSPGPHSYPRDPAPSPNIHCHVHQQPGETGHALPQQAARRMRRR